MKPVFTLPRIAPIWVALMLCVGAGPALAEPATLLDYGVGVVSNYVFRGVDVFTGVQDKEGEKHSSFNVAPAVQPSLTLYGPGGLSFGLWSSFALTNRSPEESKGFAGLKEFDELDYTLAWDWKNRLGSFKVGIADYAIVPARGALNEVFITWAPTFLEGLSPLISHYSDTNSAVSYTSFGVSGGEAVTWGANLGLSTKGPQDITASVGTGLGESMSVAFNLAYRPTPSAVGPYDSEGKYAVKGAAADYPPAIFWLSFSYGGSVTE